MRPLLRTLIPVLFIATALLATVTSAPASPANRDGVPPPVDVMDVYVGAVNMNNCCDCHASVC